MVGNQTRSRIFRCPKKVSERRRMFKVPCHRFRPVWRLCRRGGEGSLNDRLRGLPRAGCIACRCGQTVRVGRSGRGSEDRKEMRESISKTPKDSVCIGCHVVQGHQKHPTYEGERLAMAASGPVGPCDSARVISERLSSITGPVIYSSRYSIKTCGGCHYDQYRQWRAGKHSSLSAMLPAKYLSDQSCKDCHSNTTAITTKNMASDSHHHSIGVACETCHGPAFEHIQFNKQF